MLKKRVVFTLLYNDGVFMLSRNFRLQKVGDLQWLQKNYNFSQIAFSIDELIILDVTRGPRNIKMFCECLKKLTEGCFVPIAAGGGIKSLDDARLLMRSGADKIVVNSALYDSPEFIGNLASEIGRQSIVASVDANRNIEGDYEVMAQNGSALISGNLRTVLQKMASFHIGELYLNSINRDGTGQGYDLEMLDQISESLIIPVILAGGAGNFNHFAQGLKDSRVDAVATAHLFNFVGDGLKSARKKLIELNLNVAKWHESQADYVIGQNLKIDGEGSSWHRQ